MASDILSVVMTCFSSYGIAFIFALTHGPFGVCHWIRRKVIEHAKAKWIQTGIHCPVCIGFWVGMAVAAWFGTGVAGWLTSVGFICTVTALSPDES